MNARTAHAGIVEEPEGGDSTSARTKLLGIVTRGAGAPARSVSGGTGLVRTANPSAVPMSYRRGASP